MVFMQSLVVSAGALIAYAVLVALSASPESGATPEMGGGVVGLVAEGIRVTTALALAAALLMRLRQARRLVLAFSIWFGLFGALSLAGQLYQRFVSDGSGNYIIINRTTFAFNLATEFALLVVLLGSTLSHRRKRVAGRGEA